MAKSRNGEIVWRIQFLTNATGKTAHAEPVILILADKKGWQYLAAEFSAMAKRKATKSMIAAGDGDDHQHLDYKYEPVNSSLSHQMEFRLGVLTPKTRSQTLKKYGIKPSPKGEDLPRLFTSLVNAATKDVRETNRLFRRVAREPKMSDEDLYAAFGMKLPKKHNASKTKKRK